MRVWVKNGSFQACPEDKQCCHSWSDCRFWAPWGLWQIQIKDACFFRISPFSCVCSPRICFQGSQVWNAREAQRTPPQCWHGLLPGKGPGPPQNSSFPSRRRYAQSQPCESGMTGRGGTGSYFLPRKLPVRTVTAAPAQQKIVLVKS